MSGGGVWGGRPHELIPERNPEAEALRVRLVDLGATIDRQWGGTPWFAVHLPGPGVKVIGARYADYPDRAAARLAGMRNALFELVADEVQRALERTTPDPELRAVLDELSNGRNTP